mmetsp:Transcript_12189/g.29774  ORF Transcript_12189/g.29774 Transcript_12189/m.29774 type:complete len:121 (+) Transcript_12189:240-602(+)
MIDDSIIIYQQRYHNIGGPEYAACRVSIKIISTVDILSSKGNELRDGENATPHRRYFPRHHQRGGGKKRMCIAALYGGCASTDRGDIETTLRRLLLLLANVACRLRDDDDVIVDDAYDDE